MKGGGNMITNDESKNNNGLTIRVPKPNMQVIILGFVALITLFQTFQLIRISAQAGSATIKTAAPVTGSNADVPQSMVGGC